MRALVLRIGRRRAGDKPPRYGMAGKGRVACALAADWEARSGGQAPALRDGSEGQSCMCSRGRWGGKERGTSPRATGWRAKSGDEPPRNGMAVRSAHLSGSHFLGDLALLYLADGEAPSPQGELCVTLAEARELPLPRRERARACPVLDTGVRVNLLKSLHMHTDSALLRLDTAQRKGPS